MWNNSVWRTWPRDWKRPGLWQDLSRIHDSVGASGRPASGLVDAGGIDAADEVLHALVQIGSPSGRDCRPAGGRGLGVAARRECGGPTGAGGSETDALVASQLCWRSGSSGGVTEVAGNVLANMRSVLAREGVLKRSSWAERRTVPTDRLPEQQLRKQVSPSEELIDVLSWGEHVGLIGSGDRLLPLHW